MSRGWSFKSGEWNVHCDVCSKKIKSGEAKHRWDGYIVCDADYEERHPLDFIRVHQEKIAVPFVRKQPDVFLTGCTRLGRNGLVGVGIVGCMVVGNNEDVSGLL